jgi:lysophospholipase L1-like esterase
MLECLIIGDSIAVGVSQVRKECVSIAQSGINSRDWNRQHLSKLQPTKTLIISLGANDYSSLKTEDNLREIRKKAQADRIFWLLPSSSLKPTQVDIVKRIANEFGDVIINRPESNMSPDGVHPTGQGYKELANRTK